jgi:adenosylhomocysteine nucleosidase
MSGGIVAVTSLALEAGIAAGSGVSVICSQGERLAAALESAVERGARGIISFGIAGGLAPGLAAGDWIAAAAVITARRLFPTDQTWTRSLRERLPRAVQADILGVDDLVLDPERKQLLYAQTGAVAVDMESHIAAAIAGAHRIPFAAARVIIDPADTPLPAAASVGLRPDGTADAIAVFRSVLEYPRQLPTLVRTAINAGIARAALRRGRQTLGAGLSFPDVADGHRVPAAKDRDARLPEVEAGFVVGGHRIDGLRGAREAGTHAY